MDIGKSWSWKQSGCGKINWHEHDDGDENEEQDNLDVMVNDFIENYSTVNSTSCGSHSYSWFGSSDSGSSLCAFPHLAEKIIQICKISVTPYESELLLVVDSLIRSMNQSNLHIMHSGPCYASCIRFYLVKLMRLYGYDAAVCFSKWQTSANVPGGDHEYIDVINNNVGNSERLIIDIDFQSHFEIARAVDSYDRILNSLPVVYVGSFTRLKQFLGIMVEAARSSLKQNSMPLPPWRSLAYLQAKWQSPYQRYTHEVEGNNSAISKGNCFDHKQCRRHLRRLQSWQLGMEAEGTLKPRNKETNIRNNKPDKLRQLLCVRT